MHCTTNDACLLCQTATLCNAHRDPVTEAVILYLSRKILHNLRGLSLVNIAKRYMRKIPVR